MNPIHEQHLGLRHVLARLEQASNDAGARSLPARCAAGAHRERARRGLGGSAHAFAEGLHRHEWEESRLAASPPLLDPDHDPFRGR